jgi:hypothetical protein
MAAIIAAVTGLRMNVAFSLGAGAIGLIST